MEVRQTRVWKKAEAQMATLEHTKLLHHETTTTLSRQPKYCLSSGPSSGWQNVYDQQMT